MLAERTSVGLDVHARSVVAAAIDGMTGEMTRALQAAGVACVVVAPSKLQRPAGDRVKTDARDALHLARLLRIGEITPVAVPSVEQEAARDLVRAREDCRGGLMRARHRLSKLLLRHGIVYCEGKAWTNAHDAWLRRQRLDAAIIAMAVDSEFSTVVRRLPCLRGVSALTAFGLAVEIGDWQRFTGNSIGSFIGLVPSENSSSSSRALGPITKTGNTHARRLLVEAAWHHRPAYRPSKTTSQRWQLAPAAASARGDAGNRRLHERWISFDLRKKRPVIANVAIARELAGWCWSLAVMD